MLLNKFQVINWLTRCKCFCSSHGVFPATPLQSLIKVLLNVLPSATSRRHLLHEKGSQVLLSEDANGVLVQNEALMAISKPLNADRGIGLLEWPIDDNHGAALQVALINL